MPWSEEQRKAAAERMRTRMAQRKNIIDAKNQTETHGLESSTVTVVTDQEKVAKNGLSAPNSPIPEPVLKKPRFQPYVGPDSLPIPGEGRTYGEPRYYLNGGELIQVRKKIIHDPKSQQSGLVVVKTCFININTETAKKSGLRTILKQCNIPGAA